MKAKKTKKTKKTKMGTRPASGVADADGELVTWRLRLRITRAVMRVLRVQAAHMGCSSAELVRRLVVAEAVVAKDAGKVEVAS